MSDSITVLTARGNLRQTKFITHNLIVEPADKAKRFSAEEHSVNSLSDLDKLLVSLQRRSQSYVLRGVLADPKNYLDINRRSSVTRKDPEAPGLREKPHKWVALDLDDVPYEGDPNDLESCYSAAIALLPREFHAVDCIVQATGSHGIKPGARLRLWFWLDRFMSSTELRVWFKDCDVDPAIFTASTPVYTAAPVFDVGLTDHIKERGLRIDLFGDDVVRVPAIEPPPPPVSSKPEASIEDLTSAIEALPNDDEDWHTFNDKGMALFRATGGGEEGRELFHLWSEKSDKHNPDVCDERWDHYHSSPPDRLGAGSIFHWAKAADSKWVQPSKVIPPASAHFKGETLSDGQVEIIMTDWVAELKRYQNKDGSAGAIKPTLWNAWKAFVKADIWQESLVYDQYARKVLLLAPPPWARKDETYPRNANDNDITRATLWLSDYGIVVPSGMTAEAWSAAAMERGFHPVRRYLNSVQWDGVSRLDAWLIDHLGAANNTINRAFGSKFLISAVARIFEPGCKVDTILVLEGVQGMRKSSALEVLATRKWFVDDLKDVTGKEILQQLQGKWIAEFAEMDKLSRVDISRVKAFISTGSDNYRAPYGRVPEDHPRQCVFAATINPGSLGYLTDESGARRYWPVECGIGWEEGQRVDLAALATVRDQLWAEAVARYQAGEKHYLDERSLEVMQEYATRERYQRSPWAEQIEDYLDSLDIKFVTIRQVLLMIGVHDRDFNRSKEVEVGKILRANSWFPGTKRLTQEDGTLSKPCRGFMPKVAGNNEIIMPYVDPKAALDALQRVAEGLI